MAAPESETTATAVWEEVEDENKQIYYYNTTTGETAWDDPRVRFPTQVFLTRSIQVFLSLPVARCTGLLKGLKVDNKRPPGSKCT